MREREAADKKGERERRGERERERGGERERERERNREGDREMGEGELVSWCFEPSQPQRITSGL